MTASYPTDPAVRADADRGIIAAGLKWLYETVQPDGAIIQHHGVTRGNRYQTRRYGFCPSGAKNLPVVSVEVAHWSRNPDTNVIGPMLEAGEMDAIGAVIIELGGPVRETWNGDGCLSGSFGLTVPAHPSLAAAVGRYRANCPTHHTVFCGQADFAKLHHEPAPCTWYRDGNALIVHPAWPPLVPWKPNFAAEQGLPSQRFYTADLAGHTFTLLSTDAGVTWVAQRDGRMVTDGAVTREQANEAADQQWHAILRGLSE